MIAAAGPFFLKCFEIHPLTPLVGTPYLFSRHNYVKTSLKFNSVEETGLRHCTEMQRHGRDFGHTSMQSQLLCGAAGFAQ